MISQMIVKSNIFDKINDHMSTDMAKQVLKWWNSKTFRSLDSNCGQSSIKCWTVSGISHTEQIGGGHQKEDVNE